MEITAPHLIAAFAAAFIAGGINSVAGGGTMISFPVLLALGLPPIIANATNTAGIWAGGLGSLWGFRAEFARIPKLNYWLLIPCLLGGTLGALLLRWTSPDFFERIVPGLILFATAMFIVSPLVREHLKKRQDLNPARHRISKLPLVFLGQLLVGIYGGYFGAGMSIIMLSLLGILGMADMLEMTAMTSFLSLAVNGVAAVVFAASGLITWPYVAVMSLGAISGGYGAAGIARKVGGVWIRRLVIAVGLTLAVIMFIRVLD